MILLDNLFGRFPDIRGQVIIWKKKAGIHSFRSTELQKLGDKYTEIDEDIYFHTVTHDPEKFDLNGRGKNKTAQQITCFWADIDLATKDSIKYPTKDEVRQLFTRLENKGIGPSCVINSSSGGIHVYWYLDKPYECSDYMGVVKSWIRMLTIEINEIADRKITVDTVGEMARVLRLPGTMNKRTGEQVTLNFERDLYYPIEKLIEATTYTKEGNVSNKQKTNKLLENMGMVSPVKLGLIENLMPQCAQLKEYAETKGQMIEPVWYQMAGLFSYLYQGQEMFITISELADPFMDSDRSQAGAVKKMEQWQAETTGPPTCKAMDLNNPDVCNHCPHWEKITTPIQLSHSAPVPIGTQLLNQNDDEELLVQEIPREDADYQFVPPSPYFFSEEGCLMIEKGKTEQLVANNRIVPLQRITNDMGRKNITLFQVLEHGETVENAKSEPVPISQGEISGKQGVSELNDANALISNYAEAELRNYLTQTIKIMNKHKKAMVAHDNIGWKDDEFLLGKMRVMKGGAFQQDELSDSLQQIIGDISYKGKIDEWRKATSVLNRLGMEPHRLAFFGGFAAPLFKATDHAGILVNLLSRDSGTFKSFTLKMITSIYGEPNFNIITNRDTENAMMRKISTRCDLPITYDEITNIEPNDFSDLVYSITQGKDKDRLNSAAEMMKATNPWRTVMLTSSNASLDDKLGAVNTAERMRLLELSVQDVTKHNPISPNEASQVMHTLSDNYGGVGLMWISHLVDNKERIFNEARQMIRIISEETGRANDKRFWITFIALSLIAAKETHSLGFHTCNLKALKDYGMSVLNTHHEKIIGDQTSVYEKIDEYLTTNIEGTMVVSRRASGIGTYDIIQQPRREVTVYIEQITGAPGKSEKHVYINRSRMRSFLSDKREDINELIKQLIGLDVMLKDSKGKPKSNFVKRIPLSQVGGADIGLRVFAINLTKYSEILGELKL